MKRATLTITLCLVLPVFGQQMPSSPTSVRLQYALLNDTSGKNLWPNGIRQQVKLEDEFLTEVIKPGADVGSLVNFAENYFLDVQNSTDPKNILSQAFFIRGEDGVVVGGWSRRSDVNRCPACQSQDSCLLSEVVKTLVNHA